MPEDALSFRANQEQTHQNEHARVEIPGTGKKERKVRSNPNRMTVKRAVFSRERKPRAIQFSRFVSGELTAYEPDLQHALKNGSACTDSIYLPS